ncbi:MAG: hypothetical protein ACU83N_10970 [Gammaproteobacteria bacterium]
MQTMKTYSIASSMACLLTGCSNALYFYETEKISLTAEARPDSSQPVQGSLGLKQRVVLIAPPKDSEKAATTSVDSGRGDALSAISSFSFKIIPKAGTIFNPVLIQTAFITGDAAAQLCPTEAANAAQAITLEGIDIRPIDELAGDIVKDIKNDADRNTLKQITARDFDSLSDQDYQNITRITSLVKGVYSRELHEALGKILTN